MSMKGTFILSNKWDIRFLEMAKLVASWSKDPSTQVGAIAVRNRNVIAQGYNGFPRGVVDTHSRLLDKETKYKYIVHAEMNCIYNAAYQGSCLVGSTMYVHGLPVCHECAKGIIQSGIIRVVSPKIKEPTVIAMKWKQSMKLTMDLFTEVVIRYDFV